MPDDPHRYAGEAALCLVESLLIHLVETGRLSQEDLDEVFFSAIDTHRAEHENGGHPKHRAIAELLEKVQFGSHGVRLYERS